MKLDEQKEILESILLLMNYDSSKTLSEQQIQVPPRQQMPSDYLGTGGRFQAQFPEYDPKQQEKILQTVRIKPSEYTKKLSDDDYDEFLKERNRILNLPPSFKATEYNKKYSEALNEFTNYDKKYDDYYSSQKRYLNQLEYLTALYYPEKWTPGLKQPVDAHDALLLVAVGIFAIPLLLAAAGASASVVATAAIGAQAVSAVADVSDSILYLNEGNLEMAGLSAIFALIPFVPNLAKYSKPAIESAVKKYGKGLSLNKVEKEIISDLSKKETKQQITNAAEQSAKNKLSSEGISNAVAQGTNVVKNLVSKGANMTTRALNTTVGNIATTLVGFYVVGQSYNKAVENYKKTQLTPFKIYQKLASDKKITMSWNDLKWVFGSDGSASDNEKLASAMLAGYDGIDSNQWLYNHPDFRTKTWNTKWLPTYEKSLEKQKEYETTVSSVATNDEKSKENREKAVSLQKEKLLTDESGVKHSEEEFAAVAMKLLNNKDLFDISKPYENK